MVLQLVISPDDAIVIPHMITLFEGLLTAIRIKIRRFENMFLN